MDLQPKGRPRLSDEDVSNDAPYMRALVAQRLEVLWQACRPGFEDTGDPAWRPDTRSVESGLRVLRYLGALYRLDLPQGAPLEAVAGTKTELSELVAGQLAEIERRMASGA